MCVLVVEDEPMIRELMAECLVDAGFEVEEARSGDEAVEIILEQPGRFAALVTDFHMPGHLDGSEVAAVMRRQTPDIPVVIASGRPDMFQESWQSELGYTLIRKPFGLDQLVHLVQRLVQQ
jgi:CheY-like chemotaxis protein